MGQEAFPVLRALREESIKYPEGGKELDKAMKKRLGGIKEKSLQEKKMCSLRYRKNMIWSGIFSQEEFEQARLQALEDYQNGSFFLERIGRYRSVDPKLTLTILNLRDEWIKEYDVKTAPEFIFLDMALTGYFHFIRLNEAINNIEAGIEYDLFVLDAPRFELGVFGEKINDQRENKSIAEKLANHLCEVLQPLLDQYNRMFIRNMKALRDLKRGNILLNIGNVGQVNIGDKQINVDKGTGYNPDNSP
jgi:hypothetical protein